VESYFGCIEELEDKILDLSGFVDITYNDSRKVISKICEISEPNDDIL
jgi:hypothetical protein